MTGIEKLREYAENLKGTDRYDAVGTNIESLADQIERETLPRPLFEDGSPVQFGDEFVSWNGYICTVRTITASDNILVINYGGPNNFVVGERDNHGKRVKRPAPKVLDADGVPIEQGDEVWEVGRASRYTVSRVDAGHGRVYLVDSYATEGYSGERVLEPGKLTHKKPELFDSWERIEEGAKSDTCDYFGGGCGEGLCKGCPASESLTICSIQKAVDLVRRCRALAEKEDGR